MLVKLCTILAGVCLLYYALITVYAGFTLDAAWLWPAGAAALLATGKLWQMVQERRIPDIWRTATGLAWLLAAVFLAYLLTGVITHLRDDTNRDLDYVIVLGAQVKGTVPSKSLGKRIEKAWEYAQAHPDAVLILSGGKGSGEDITEAECMRRVLVEKGLSAERMVLEENSTSTRENLLFSDRLSGCGAKPCGIISNDFHICRALNLARKTGYADAVGIAALSDPVLELHFILREAAGLLLMKLQRG